MEYSTDVPDWIKISAKWWNKGHITDIDFEMGIKFLIKNDIVKPSSIMYLEPGDTSKNIPEWFKVNAGWWGDGFLTDQNFVDGVEWLIENEIIAIKTFS